MQLVAFKEANDTVVSERSIFSKNHEFKSFLRVAVNQYVTKFWDLDMQLVLRGIP